MVCNGHGCAHEGKRNGTFPTPLEEKMNPFEAKTFICKWHLFEMCPLQNDLVIVAVQALEGESAGSPLSCPEQWGSLHVRYLTVQESVNVYLCPARFWVRRPTWQHVTVAFIQPLSWMEHSRCTSPAAPFCSNRLGSAIQESRSHIKVTILAKTL